MLTCSISYKSRSKYKNTKGCIPYSADVLTLDGKRIPMVNCLGSHDLRKLKRKIRKNAKWPVMKGRPVRFTK